MDGGLRRLASVSCPNTYIAGLRKPGFQRGRAFVHDPHSDTAGFRGGFAWARRPMNHCVGRNTTTGLTEIQFLNGQTALGGGIVAF